MFTWVLRRYVASTDILVPKPLKGADHVNGQVHRDKECPFSGIPNSGRVWRKVPESDPRSVVRTLSMCSEKPTCTQPHNLSFAEVKNPLTDTCFLCPRKVWMRWQVAGSHMWIKFMASPVA